MDFLLYGVILAVAVSLLANIIFRWIDPDKPALIIAAATLIIICVLLAWYRQDKPNLAQQPPPQDRTYEIKKYTDIPWDQLISGANYRVFATGTILTPFTIQRVKQLIEKIRKAENFTAKLIMLKPNGSAVKARVVDEKTPLIPFNVAGKLLELRELITHELSPNDKNRLMVKCIDVYPTMAVIIIDDDLYTYSYPFGARATDSTVIIFRKFASDPQISNLAAFFERHFNSIAANATEPTDEDYAEYKKLVSQKSQ